MRAQTTFQYVKKKKKIVLDTTYNIIEHNKEYYHMLHKWNTRLSQLKICNIFYLRKLNLMC